MGVLSPFSKSRTVDSPTPARRAEFLDAGTVSTRARTRERGLYHHDFVSVSDHLGSIRRVGLQNN
jgi:hypothetical protein